MACKIHPVSNLSIRPKRVRDFANPLTVDPQGRLHLFAETADLATSHLALRIGSAGYEDIVFLQEFRFFRIYAIPVREQNIWAKETIAFKDIQE
jgi:hypothetical protein